MRATLVAIVVVIIVVAIVATQHREIRDWLAPEGTPPSATLPVAPPDAAPQAAPRPSGIAESGTAEPAPKPETASTGTATMTDEAPTAPGASAETRAAAPPGERKTARADAAPAEPAETPAAAPAPAVERKTARVDAAPTESAETPAATPEPGVERKTARADAAPPEPTETPAAAPAPAVERKTARADATPAEPAETPTPAPAVERKAARADAAPPEPTETPAAAPAPAVERKAVRAELAETAPETRSSTAPARETAGTAPPPSSVARALPGDAEEAPSAAARPAAKTPSFDVVRVSPEGDAVIAGRADPGAEVTVKIGDEVLGKTSADRRGEWVLVPEKPLPGGAGELHLEEKTASGERKSSEEAVVVYVPERAPKDTGGQTGGQGAVVVATPRAGGASRMLQAPAPPDRGPTAADAQGAGGSGDPVAAPADAQTAAQDAAPQPLTPRTDKDLSLEIIDYDEEGHVVLSGKAPPGSEVRATVDEETVGTVQADEAGEWQIAPSDPVVSDSHAIRIEQVGEGGVVLAKLNVPFSRAAVRPGELAPGTVVIQPGNNLWRIARATYGAGVKYTLIFAANADQIDNPHLIYPDQIFVVPPEALPDRTRRSAP